tara:strand:+ start:553 stop:705 length:153 start_codon:yes stop_codon:yes gene_type:complete
VSYRLYVNGVLAAACYTQAEFKATALKLEGLYGEVFNAPGSALQSNVKTK